MQNQKSNQKGFTLIELIIVIVILGILAVTAAPRFIDLQSDAKASTLEGVKAALQGSSQLVYAKAAIQGKQGDATATVELSTGISVATVFGYPDAASVTANANVVNFLDISANDFTVFGDGTGENNFVITFQDTTATDRDETVATNCYIQYTNAASANAAPTIATVATGC
jgi:MSHA pilin protein MshA